MTAQARGRSGPHDALGPLRAFPGHRGLARAVPPRVDRVEAPATLVPVDAGPEERAGAARAWLARLGGWLALPSRADRRPDAGRLTDRQLADIGLARHDVEAPPGWLGRAAEWNTASPWGRPDHDG